MCMACPTRITSSRTAVASTINWLMRGTRRDNGAFEVGTGRAAASIDGCVESTGAVADASALQVEAVSSLLRETSSPFWGAFLSFALEVALVPRPFAM